MHQSSFKPELQLSEGKIKNKCCRNNSDLKLGKDTLLIYLCLFRLVCKKYKIFLPQKLTWCFLVTYDHNLLVCVCVRVCVHTLLPVHTHTPLHSVVMHFVLTHSRRVKLQSSEGAPRGPLQSILCFLSFLPLSSLSSESQNAYALLSGAGRIWTGLNIS